MDRFEVWRSGALRGANASPTAALDDLIVLRHWGANLVSFGIDSLLNFQPSFPLRPDRIDDVRTALDRAEKAGLFVTINFRSAPGREILGMDSRLFQDYEFHDIFIRMWRATAYYLKDDDRIVGYDLLCEPDPEALFQSIDASVQPGLGLDDMARRLRNTPADWSDLAARTTEAIREVDPDTPIIINSSGSAYPQTFAYLEPTWDLRTVYSVHFQSPRLYTDQSPGKGHRVEYPGTAPRHVEAKQFWDRRVLAGTLKAVRDFQQKADAPIFVGQFGCVRWAPNAVGYLADLVDLFEEYGWSWAYWEFRGADGMDAEKTPDPHDRERRDETALARFYQSRFSRNRVYPRPRLWNLEPSGYSPESV